MWEEGDSDIGGEWERGDIWKGNVQEQESISNSLADPRGTCTEHHTEGNCYALLRKQ